MASPRPQQRRRRPESARRVFWARLTSWETPSRMRCLVAVSAAGVLFFPFAFIFWPPDPPLSTLTAGFLLAAYILGLLGVALEAVVVSQLWPMTGPAPKPAEPRR